MTLSIPPSPILKQLFCAAHAIILHKKRVLVLRLIILLLSRIIINQAIQIIH